MAATVPDSDAGSNPQSEGHIEITVLSLAGEELLMEKLSSDGTVMDLKNEIANRCGHFVEVQQLSCEDLVFQ